MVQNTHQFNQHNVTGHDAVVLSAFGCGAYGNPPHHVTCQSEVFILKTCSDCRTV
jgi:hypothetical protein